MFDETQDLLYSYEVNQHKSVTSGGTILLQGQAYEARRHSIRTWALGCRFCLAHVWIMTMARCIKTLLAVLSRK